MTGVQTCALPIYVDVNAQGTSPGCMSFPKDADCPPVMGALGLAYDGVPATSSQRFLIAK